MVKLLLTSPGVEDPRSPGIRGGVGRNKVICEPATVGTASASQSLAGVISPIENDNQGTSPLLTIPCSIGLEQPIFYWGNKYQQLFLPFFKRLLLRPSLSPSSGGWLTFRESTLS